MIRTVCAAAAAIVITAAAPAPAQKPPASGPVIIDITSARRELYKIAVPQLLGDASVAHQAAEVISFDLAVSGWFRVLDPKGFLANLQAEGTGIVVTDWRNVGAEGVSKGRVTVSGGEVTCEFKLYELGSGDKPVLEKTYRGPVATARALAHRWSNDVVRFFSKEDGFFETQIVFSGQTAPGRKEIFVMDYDGANLRQLTNNGSQNVLPAWSPSGDKVFFTSFLRGNPDLYQVGLGGGRARKVSDRPGVNMGAAVSPDGSRLALTLSQDGNPEIYLLGVDGGLLKRLTDNPFIDTSPAFSADGGRIAFVSNRLGSPQIFLMSASGGGATRLTRVGSYNQEPAFCPRCEQPTVAFTARDEKGSFDIFTINVDSGQLARLTENQGSFEHPSWAPNGRALVVSATRGGLYVVTADGKTLRQVYKGKASTPAWGPARK